MKKKHSTDARVPYLEFISFGISHMSWNFLRYNHCDSSSKSCSQRPKTLICCKMNIFFNSIRYTISNGCCCAHIRSVCRSSKNRIVGIFERIYSSHISSYLNHFDRMLSCTITSDGNSHFLRLKWHKHSQTYMLTCSYAQSLSDIQSE